MKDLKLSGEKHYKGLSIEPIEYILANDIPFCEGNVIKYVSRWREKGGLADLDKAMHYLTLLKDHELNLMAENLKDFNWKK